MSTYNPFFHRGAIRRAEEFHGREEQISQILGLARNGQSVSIVGPRRIGKSSLLLHLRRSSTRSALGISPEKMVVALVDCQELGGSPPEEVYEALMTSIMESSAIKEMITSKVERPGTYRSLDLCLGELYRSGVSVIVMLDEFELLAANKRLTPYFFARLRGLTTKYGLAYLTASQRPLFDITADEEILSSPFFNIFVTLSLGLFTDDEAYRLFDKRLEGTGIDFSPALRDYLIQFVGPHPFFLHIAGYHGFTASVESRTSGGIGDFSALDAPIEIEADSHLSYLWHNLSQEEQYCLTILDGPIDPMRLLEQQCLVSSEYEGYLYTSTILKRFIRKQRVQGVIQAGPFVIDSHRHQVHADGQELSLTTSQFELLTRLGSQFGQVVSGAQLETAVWGDALLDDPDRLKTLIKRLRRAIAPYDGWIISERGVGYALREPQS
ncbi:MAG: winged helix-turn-helix domain-containing protein [Candidatus Promineifilaceae bacterium]